MKYVDLHMHTFYSDGMDAPNQVIRTAKLRGLDMIAIADHDNLRGYYEALQDAETWGITLVPGVEISTIQHHLLGLNFDPNNEGFVRFVQHSKDIQRGVCHQRVELLEAHGVPVTFDKVEKAFPYSTLGKYSILMTMLSDKTCREYLEEHHGQLKVRDLFEAYLSNRGIAGDVEKRRVVEWEEAIEEIHKANGLAIFPHPSTKAEDPSEVLNMMRGIDGIEVQPQYGEKNRPFQDYAEQKGLFLTFGSDYHGSAFDSLMLGKGENTLDETVLGEIRK